MTEPTITPQLSVRSGGWSRLIEKLDAKEDALQIESILFGHVFPLDFFMAAEFAQLQSFTIPTISGLLQVTGEYERDNVKRLIDTQILMSRVIGSIDTERGRAMADHVNQLHSFYNISNDDFLYTLSTFIFEPVFWIDRYGWRALTTHEKTALYHVYARVGEAMHIKNIPASFDEFQAWRSDYEAKAQRYAESNRIVAELLIGAIRTFFPSKLQWMAFPLTSSLLAKETSEALGLPRPNWLFHAIVHSMMWLRARFNRVINIWEEASFFDSPIIQGAGNDAPSDPFQIGPPKLIAKINQQKAARQSNLHSVTAR